MGGRGGVVDSRDGFVRRSDSSSALMRALPPFTARGIAGHDGTHHVEGKLRLGDDDKRSLYSRLKSSSRGEAIQQSEKPWRIT